MFSVYDGASFHRELDMNLNELLQARVENLSHSDMITQQNIIVGGIHTQIPKGRLAFCTTEPKENYFAYSDGTKWVFIGDTSININSLYKPDPAKVVATTDITLAGLQTIDGVALVSGDLVLVAGQTNAAHNGLYVADLGTWDRSPMADIWDELVSAMVVVEQGTVNRDTQWMCITDKGGTLDTTPLEWLKIPLMNDIVARNGLKRTDNYIDVNPDETNNTTFINSNNEVEVKRSTTGAVGLDSNIATGGIKVNVDNTTVGINASNQLYAKGAFKALSTLLNNEASVTPGTGILLGKIQSGYNIQINHNFNSMPLMIQFHYRDGNTELLLNNVIYPEIVDITNNSIVVKFWIHDISNLDGSLIEELDASKVHVSIIGQGA